MKLLKSMLALLLSVSVVGCGGDAVCGDATLEDPEACDDGNNTDGDGCSAVCEVEPGLCGNGTLDANEACDDGNNTDNDGCSAVCVSEVGEDCGPPPNLTPNAQLQFCDLRGVELISVDLSGADLTGANLFTVDFAQAELTGAIFVNAETTFTNFTGANLSATDFTGTTLSKAQTGNLLGCPALLPSSDFRCVALPSIVGRFAILGPEVNIAFSPLTDADLSGAILTGAILTGANLTNTNLSDADFSGATGQPNNAALAVYSNTICPNGQNSDDNGDTCVGQGF